MKLYLIPTPIGDNSEQCQPSYNREIINTLDFFIVENLRSARRFLSSLKLDKKIDDMTFLLLDKRTEPKEVAEIMTAMLAHGKDCGVLSEAGVPCVADPGSLIVAEAHKKSIEIVPLVGASSILLALMASGANGQSFAFNGYLPIKQPERNRAIKDYERRVVKDLQTQIFIETPYRNDKLMADFIGILAEQTKLTIAVNLCCKDQFITTKTVAQWHKEHLRQIGKKPAIFIMH